MTPHRHTDARLGRAEDAKECIRLDPSFWKGFLRAAGAAEAQGDLRAAKLYCQRGVEKHPTKMPLAKKLAEYMRQSSTEELGEEVVQINARKKKMQLVSDQVGGWTGRVAGKMSE